METWEYFHGTEQCKTPAVEDLEALVQQKPHQSVNIDKLKRRQSDREQKLTYIQM